MKQSRLHLLITSGLALCLVLFGLYQTLKCVDAYASNFGMYHDDGIYTVCAKSLAEGRGYRIISLPDEPFETKYPPAFSLLLSAAFSPGSTFPSNIFALETIPAVIGLLFTCAAGALLVVTGRATLLMALAVVAASWLNLDLLTFLPVPMSDLMFGGITVLAIWLGERAARQPSPAVLSALSFTLISATLTHVTGTILVLTSLVFLLAKRRYLASLVVGLSCLLVIFPLWFWAGVHSAVKPAVMVYYTNYLLAGVTASQHLKGALPFALSNLGAGISEITARLVPGFKWLLPAIAPNIQTVIVACLTWPLLALGLIRELSGFRSSANREDADDSGRLASRPYRLRRSRRGGLLALWVILYSLSHLLFPKFAGQRHLLILLPFTYYYLFTGWRDLWFKILVRSSGGSARLQMVRAACAVIFAALVIAGNAGEDFLWAGRYAWRVPPPVKAPPAYSEASEFHEAYAWIRMNTKPEEVIVWNNDPATYLFTGRKAIMSCLGENWRMLTDPGQIVKPSDLLESIKFARGDYLVIDPIFVGGLSGFDQLGAAVTQITKDKPRLLAPVFTSRFGLITIFKIDPQARDSLDTPS